MKQQLILSVLFIILTIKSFTQIIFEDGYLINESDQKINCLIKNVDWKNNPEKFEYKISPQDSVRKADIHSIKEFGIIGSSKYIRANVKIDLSSDEVKKLNYEKNPIFQDDTLFLKVLVEGKASLYIYERESLTRFFYNLNDKSIDQLVYKRYRVDVNAFAQNIKYKQQLFVDLVCEDISYDYINQIKYSKEDLMKLFVLYNKCSNSYYVDYQNKKNLDLFNLSLRPSINYSDLSIKNSTSGIYINFDQRLNFRLGIETEFIFPFNKNKWSIILDPTYQHFKSEKSTNVSTVSGGILVTKLNYQSVELPVGIRHNFFLNDKSKIYLNIALIIDFKFNSNIEMSRNDGSILYSLDINPRNNYVFGSGFKFNDKFSIEIQYQTNREILGKYLFWNSNFQTLSVILGYTLI
jgi:hypothetical protein